MKIENGSFKFECGWELGALVFLIVAMICYTIRAVAGCP